MIRVSVWFPQGPGGAVSTIVVSRSTTAVTTVAGAVDAAAAVATAAGTHAAWGCGHPGTLSSNLCHLQA